MFSEHTLFTMETFIFCFFPPVHMYDILYQFYPILNAISIVMNAKETRNSKGQAGEQGTHLYIIEFFSPFTNFSFEVKGRFHIIFAACPITVSRVMN